MFAYERKQTSMMADEKSPAQISHRLFAARCSEMGIGMKKKLMRRFCIWGVYCLCVLLMLIVSGVGGKAEQTAAISANDCYENRIAITFDDGPGKGTTEKLLDGLKERGVKATFFLVGEKIEDNRELVERMYAEGHLIGNHTFTHVQLSKVDGKQALEEIVKTNTLIEEITGEPVRYIRPPYGSYSNSLLMQINMTPVLWSVDPEDWNTDNTGQVVKSVVANVKCGDIILLHDIYDSSVAAALEIVDELKAKGFIFVTVDQLLLD